MCLMVATGTEILKCMVISIRTSATTHWPEKLFLKATAIKFLRCGNMTGLLEEQVWVSGGEWVLRNSSMRHVRSRDDLKGGRTEVFQMYKKCDEHIL